MTEVDDKMLDSQLARSRTQQRGAGTLPPSGKCQLLSFAVTKRVSHCYSSLLQLHSFQGLQKP